METNKIPEKQQISPPSPPAVPYPATQPNVQVKPQRQYTFAERVLVPVALLIAILFDRLVFAPMWWHDYNVPYFSGIFWMLYLVILYAVYWKRLARNKTLWLVSAFVVSLCIWNLLFDYNSEYGILTSFVIPAVLMAHAQLLMGEYKLKEIGKLAASWVLGWFYKPFSAIPALFGAVRSITSGDKQSTVKKVTVGVAITLPLLLVIIPLLCGADQVFGYFLNRLVGGFNIPSLVFHSIVVAVALMLFYSFLWNIGFENDKKDCAPKKEVQIDLLISCIVLGTVVLVYTLFCVVQFTYLFAGAGLPSHMTYSEYAREGFAQMIVICGINLVLFGVFIQYGRKHKSISVLLAALLGLTAVMLVSSFVRLRLYIGTYGLTWLRLLSAWFILYLTVVLILCGIRMIRDRLPLIAVCALILLGWYAILGYANPDALILRYNLDASGDTSAWVEENSTYIVGLSDNGILALIDADLDERAVFSVVNHRVSLDQGHSYSSYRLRQVVKERISPLLLP